MDVRKTEEQAAQERAAQDQAAQDQAAQQAQTDAQQEAERVERLSNLEAQRTQQEQQPIPQLPAEELQQPVQPVEVPANAMPGTNDAGEPVDADGNVIETPTPATPAASVVPPGSDPDAVPLTAEDVPTDK